MSQILKICPLLAIYIPCEFLFVHVHFDLENAKDLTASTFET